MINKLRIFVKYGTRGEAMRVSLDIIRHEANAVLKKAGDPIDRMRHIRKEAQQHFE